MLFGDKPKDLSLRISVRSKLILFYYPVKPKTKTILQTFGIDEIIQKRTAKKMEFISRVFQYMVTYSKGSHFKRHCKKISLKSGRECGKGENERKAEREGGVRER